ncbi:MAG: hypothetical protein IPK22_07200 [Verrucomicrobiaceae bacterium]|nr:hypothetical protein [Verrucomicrobiaceae bacterium]
MKRYDLKAGFIVEWDDIGTAKLAPLSPGTVDLLALADFVKDAVGGTWRREGTDLIVAEDEASSGRKGVRFGLALPVQVQGSYQIEVEFTRLSRKRNSGNLGTVCLLLPLPDGRSAAAFFQESNPYAGLASVRGYTTRQAENPTRIPNQLEDDRRYRGTVKVLIKGDQVDIAATLDGKPLFQFQGPVTDLESPDLLVMADPARPGMRSIDPVAWHSVRITPLDGGTLTPVRPDAIPPATSGSAAASAPQAPGAVDLLALADVVKDAEGGVWRREGADLTTADDPAKPRVKSSGTRLSLALPVRVTGSYRVEVEFTKLGRRETVSVILPLADGRSVVANFLESSDFAGLVYVRGFTLKDAGNPTRTLHQLENERRYQASVEVLINGDQVHITATFEGKPLFRFQGPVADLDSRQYAMADPARPGLKSMAPVTWHTFRLTPLDGGTLTPVRPDVILPATKP